MLARKQNKLTFVLKTFQKFTFYPPCNFQELSVKLHVCLFGRGRYVNWNIICVNVVGLCGKVLVVGDYRGGCCEKLREASPISDKASVSRLQDRPTTGQGPAHQ